MKFTFAILAIFLAFTYADHTSIENYEIEINDLVHEAENLAVNSAFELEQQIEDIVEEPLNEIEEAVNSIEELKEENESCVIAQEFDVISTVETMNDQLSNCGLIAANSSAEIMIDVAKATQQLIFDGLDVVRNLRKCRKYKNNVLKKSCFARLSIKAALYLKNARNSIKIIKESASVRIPDVIKDANTCKQNAADGVVLQLNDISAEIDACIGTN